MKKILILTLLLLPSMAHADRLGSLRSAMDVLLTTQAVSVSGVIHSTDSLQTGATFYVSSGTVAGPLYVNGGGNGQIIVTINSSTYTVTSSSAGSYTAGQYAQFSTTNNTLVGVPGDVPGGGFGAVQYNNTGALGGSNTFQFNGTTVTIQSTVTINTGGGSPADNTNPGLLNIFNGSGSFSGRVLFNIGSQGQADQVVIRDRTVADFSHLGIQSGQLIIGDVSGLLSQRIYSNGDHNAFISLRTENAGVSTSTGTWQTAATSGPGDIRLVPGGTLAATFSKRTGITLGATGSTVTVNNILVVSQEAESNAGTHLVSPSPGSGSPAYLTEFDAVSAGLPLGYLGFTASAAGVPGGLSIFNSTKNEMMRFGNSSAGVWVDDPGGLSIGSTPSTSIPIPSSGLYVVGGVIEGSQSSSVTVSGNLVMRGSLYVSTLTSNGVGGTVNADYTTTSNDSSIFVDASAANRTITLNTASNVTSQILHIQKVDTSSNTVTVVTTGADLIDGTTHQFLLNSISQKGEIQSNGTGWWSWGGGIQMTPPFIAAIPNVGANAGVGASSTVYTCAVNVPVPVTVKGFRYGGSAVAAPAQLAFGLYDFNGRLVTSTGPIAGVAAVTTVSLGSSFVNIPPGQYYIAFQGSNTAITVNGNSGLNSGPFCEATAQTAMGMPSTVTVVGGTTTARAHFIALMLNGGRSTE